MLSTLSLLAFLAPLALAGAASAQVPPDEGASCSANSDCGSFQGCLDGVCVALTPTDSNCELDADCPDAGSVCVDGLCWAPDGGGTGVDPGPGLVCEQDADCPEGMICEDGSCESSVPPPDAGSCEADADCGEGNICVACFCMPAEGTCRADADCPAGQRCDTVSVGSAGGSPDGTDPGPVCEGTYGYCAIDYTQVETNPRCETFCAVFATCNSGTVSSEDSGSSSSGGAGTEAAGQPQSAEDAECLGFCSYLLADGDAGGEMEALVACIEDNADADCETLAQTCQGEAEALGEAAGDLPAGAVSGGAEDGAGGATGGGAQAESGSLGDLFGNAFGQDEGGDGKGVNGEADAGASGDGNADGTGSSESTGCTIGHRAAPGAFGVLLLALAGLRLPRRRR